MPFTGRSAELAELAHFAELIAASGLPNADVAKDNQPATLTAALLLLATALPADTPSIVVIDPFRGALTSSVRAGLAT